jgi:hypothetical protein
MAKTDKKTMELIALVKTQKAEIAKLEKPSYKTNCSFSYIEGTKSSATNIHVETDVRKLISMAAFLAEREKSYKETARLLNVDTVPDFQWDGYTVAEWLEDIKTRINKVQIAAKRSKLELESRLKKIISPELQAELELEAIAGELEAK